jgi:glycosyltransferase involved in cell wall biosynthesis
MTVGIDLSSLQGAHRMRGIGYTLINFIGHISEAERKNNRYVFYAYPVAGGKYDDPLELLDLHDMDYEVRELSERRRSNRQLKGRLNMLVSAYNQLIELRDLYFGDSRTKDYSGVDVFLQTDQTQSLPRKRRVRKALIGYDIIPFALEWDYLWSYRTARTRGYSRKAALRVKVRRSLYIHKLNANVRHADAILTISQATKQDFLESLSVKESRARVVPLGVSPPGERSGTPSFQRYHTSSWGYVPTDFTFDDTPFLLFIGGADRRRKLEDVVAAFNHLRGEGTDIKLVLAGDSMQGPEAIATEEIQSALKRTSYIDDIVFLGFVDDASRNWLYENALAYVFPSRYEGFGLPVLEAMIRECPVISYKNSATLEVAGDAPIYADDIESLRLSILELLAMNSKQLASLREKGRKQAKKYSWARTCEHMFAELGRLT